MTVPAGPSTTRTTPLAFDVLNAVLPLARAVAARRRMSPGKFGILRHLASSGRSTSGDAASAIQVSPQAISLAAKELEVMGLITRETDADDKRKVWLVLTDEGRAALRDEQSAGAVWLDEVIAGLAPHEVAALTAAVPVLTAMGAGVRG